MTKQDDERVEKVSRVTFPTAAFSLRRYHITWIAASAKDAGISKSEFVRQVFDKAMGRGEKAA